MSGKTQFPVKKVNFSRKSFIKLYVGGMFVNGNDQLFLICECKDGEAYPYVAQDGSRWDKDGKPEWQDQGVGNSLQYAAFAYFEDQKPSETLDSPEEVS